MQKLQSPCVNICELDGQGLCRGCLRTTREIAVWASLSDEQREQIMQSLSERRKL